MENLDQMEMEVDRLVDANDQPGAVKLLVELIEQQARARNFSKAEALRERLMAVDDMALTEIIKAAEIIEAAKSSALDGRHLELFAALYDKLNEEETNALYFGMLALQAAAGDVLYHEGEVTGRLLFLNQGQLNLFFTRDDKQNMISVLEPGAVAGQDSFFIASVATTSLSAQGEAHLLVLDFTRILEWKETLPGLVDKLEQFCRHRAMGDVLAAKRLERRASRRIKLEGQVVAQVFGDSGDLAGKPFRGDLSDLSNTGMAFFINATDRAARLLMGRKLKVRLTIQAAGKGKPQTVSRNGQVVAVNALYISDYSIHLKFDTPLKS